MARAVTTHGDTIAGKIKHHLHPWTFFKKQNTSASVWQTYFRTPSPYFSLQDLRKCSTLWEVFSSDQWGSCLIFWRMCKVCKTLQTQGVKPQTYALTVSGPESPRSRGQQSMAFPFWDHGHSWHVLMVFPQRVFLHLCINISHNVCNRAQYMTSFLNFP